MLIVQGKSNIKYLLVVVILAAIVGGGIIWCTTKQETLVTQSPEIKLPKRVIVASGCMDIISWSSFSKEQQTEQCFQELELEGAGPSDCSLKNVEMVNCEAGALGDKLKCTFFCN